MAMGSTSDIHLKLIFYSSSCSSSSSWLKTDISGYGFIAQDITFQNTAGPSMHQAVATSISADHVVFYRCKFDGYQDTLYTKNGVQFFRDCEVYGTVDFIFGNAKVILQNCNIYARRPDDLQNEVTITAQGRKNKHEDTAIVLQGCTINVTQDLREREPKVILFVKLYDHLEV
ncbi:hypothetical protein FXO38_00397 [Capsicum annuum]|nr:hypothetical protein FXO38_00397 [Capsicum annuum]